MRPDRSCVVGTRPYLNIFQLNSCARVLLSLFHRPYTFTHSTLKRTLPFGRARLHITLSYTLIQRISPQQCTQQLASPIVCTHTPNRLYNSRVTHTSPTSSAHNMDDLVLDDPRSWLEEGLQDTDLAARPPQRTWCVQLGWSLRERCPTTSTWHNLCSEPRFTGASWLVPAHPWLSSLCLYGTILGVLCNISR